MTETYCLPKEHAAKFLAALKAGTINPEKLMEMSSGERRAFFKDIIGEDNAHEVNALFESKMLLKDQQKGMITWAKKVSGISETRRADIISKIEKLDRVLQPADDKAFLADLAAKKLGATVTAEEAKEIYDLSRVAQKAKDAMAKDGWTAESGTAYGRAVIDLKEKVESLKPQGKSFTNSLINAASVPKTLLTSVLHFSALGVQLWGSVTNARTWEGFLKQFQYFANEENYKNLQAYMIGHPDYNLAVKAKLGITRLGDQFSQREEAIQSSLVEQANKWLSDKTGAPNLVRASSRAFSGYLNFVRFHSYTDLLTAARNAGEDVSMNSRVIHDLADVVNDFTGRGGLGKFEGTKSVAILNAMFFAPRKVAATMHMFNPVRYLNPSISPTARIAATKNLAGSIAATAAVIGMAKAMGADVDIDPRSQNFLKINVGDAKFDITGGNAIWIRLLGRIATNQQITSKDKLIELGKGYKATTRADLILAYTRGKLSPVAGAMADALYGSDPVGRPFSVTSEAQEKLVPIFINNVVKFGMDDANNTAAIIPLLSTAFGIGIETPMPGLGGTNRDVWGEPPATRTKENDPVVNKVHSLGIQVEPVAKKIRGITLTPEELDYSQMVSGRMMKAAVSEQMQTPHFNDFPKGEQEDMIKKAEAQARKSAQDAVMMKFQHIVPEADKLKERAQHLGSEAAIARRPK